jgi:hypothetical protein
VQILIGVVATAVVTILVSRYYFTRTVAKKLGAYLILKSQVFAGIDSEVRKQLKFTFRNTEVEDLLLLQIIIANEGDRAISGFIEPLRLRLPPGTKALDASILHRVPESLRVELRTAGDGDPEFDLPLLNKGEFFVVKLLLTGAAPGKNPSLAMLADDLPRSLELKWLPPFQVMERQRSVQWVPVLVGALVIVLFAGLAYILVMLRSLQPSLFPYPWQPFAVSVASAAFMLTCGLDILGVALGLLITIMGLADVFSRRPHFTIPGKFLHLGFPYTISDGPYLVLGDVAAETLPSSPGDAAGKR